MKNAMRLQPKSRRAAGLALIALLLAGVFIFDTITDLEIAAAVFYVAVILLAVGLLQRRSVIILAGFCIGLTILSSILTTSGSREAGAINLGISIAAIALTTFLALKMVAAEAAVHEARAQLVRIARLTTLGELTASIAHEVNQPLAAAVTSADACLRWLDQDPANIEKARRSAERIVAEANRASAVIERVRGLARSEKPRRQWIDINEPVDEALALARGAIERQKISLRLDLAPALPLVMVDRIQFQQVVGNLILNAIDAMHDIPASRRLLEIGSARDDGDAVVLWVADSGIGLSPASRERLFEAFWTTKEGGMGIGLTISRSIVEAHGGRIWLDPSPGTGASFRVSLPAKGGKAR